MASVTNYHMQKLDKQKIFWHSRRGMLELDLLLVPFAQEVFSDLPYQEQLLYEQLLDEEDQDLFAWLMGQPFLKIAGFGLSLRKS